MNGIQIRLGDLVYAVVKRWKTILFLALVGCCFGLAWSGISYVQGNYTDYKISCAVALTAQSATGNFTSNSTYITNNDFHLAEDMADAAIYVMESDKVLDAAIDAVGLGTVSASEVQDKLSLDRYNETQIVEIVLKWNNETTGIQLMNAILDVSREVLPETLMIGSVAVINEPTSTYIAGGGGVYVTPVMCALGFLFGIGLAILDLIMRPTLLNLRDVEDVLGLETLGTIPQDDVFFQRKISLYEDDSGYATKQNFASIAYILRNRLGPKNERHSFYVTSTQNGEGKSTVAANVAIALAEMEKHVLLLDLDTRNPAIGNLFLENVDYNRTLNALYKGDATKQEAIISLTGFLDILPAVLEYNAIPLNSTLFELIQSLENEYDYIIIDAPPMGQTSDALSLNQISGAVLFVVRYDMVPLPDIEDALNKLDKTGVRILGCVVNGEQSIRGMTFGGGSAKTEGEGKQRPAAMAMDMDSPIGKVSVNVVPPEAAPAEVKPIQSEEPETKVESASSEKPEAVDEFPRNEEPEIKEELSNTEKPENEEELLGGEEPETEKKLTRKEKAKAKKETKAQEKARAKREAQAKKEAKAQKKAKGKKKASGGEASKAGEEPILSEAPKAKRAGLSLMDELTSDPISSYGSMSDEDAISALYRMGLDSSWRKDSSDDSSDMISEMTQGGGTPKSPTLKVQVHAVKKR